VTVAQTNIQLYNQLRRAGHPNEDLVLVHGAYELLTTLYPGHYQADGKPFVAHCVGVASIAAELGQPAEIVAFALLHNVYANSDFGDGRGAGATPSRRSLVREAVGARVEELIVRFGEVRIHPDTIESDRRALAELDETGRRLVLVALADHLEKYVDLGALYFGDDSDLVRWTDRIGRDLIEIAEALGEPRLAEMLSSAFARASAEAANVPAELRDPVGGQHTRPVVPRSCRRRLSLALRSAVRQRLRATE
jgi:(p)ppGpp synthase/HD superfamily hydrolase